MTRWLSGNSVLDTTWFRTKLERTLEDRKFIERAKGRLMDALKLNESDAHYRMQKKSMDSGRRIADVAREILELEDLSGF